MTHGSWAPHFLPLPLPSPFWPLPLPLSMSRLAISCGTFSSSSGCAQGVEAPAAGAGALCLPSQPAHLRTAGLAFRFFRTMPAFPFFCSVEARGDLSSKIL